MMSIEEPVLANAASMLDQTTPPATETGFNPLAFRPLSFLREGGSRRTAVVAWLILCAIAIPSGLLTRIFEWTGLAIDMSGTTVHLTVYLPLLICVPLVMWYGYLWAAIPAYFSTFLVALAGGMPLPWIFVFSLANPLGLAMFALLYRVTSMRTDLRDLNSFLGFIGIALVSSLAGSAGSFIWVYTSQVGVTVAYPVWQGWWLGGWLQSLFIIAPLLWLLSPHVERWLGNAKRARRNMRRRDLSHRLLPAVISAIAVLMVYVVAARIFSKRQFELVAPEINDAAIQQQVLNAIDSLSYPLYVLVAALVVVAFFGYRAAVHWNHALLDANTLLSERNDELTRLATTDTLSGVFNRRKVLEMLHAEFVRARRTGLVMSVVMVDADRFKLINDTHGHMVGDEVIAMLAHRLQKELREYDVLGRYGGEEFIVMLPETTHDDAKMVAERIRSAVNAHPLDTSAGPLPVTISGGVSTMHPTDAEDTDVIDRADRALLEAKENGRNRIVSGKEVALHRPVAV
ncbi:MAG: GGDEF domain-containing protein [Gammaproteobacteria bacterium]|nr:GGDEF domain-containing protein [Gammaproteobacteria bacterium]